ncbi:DUF6481 family protein [Rhizobium mongolense]|uniref:DUF6481 family protein n=1 Tax=Rhizobium TaxID=379 RepID=UPI0018903BCD|nr:MULTISPECIES: DUF6481 family protein [Rhizobium]QPB21720.1 hypothetical protein ISN39_09925 [Rhizobium sp. 007]ULJ73023.1 DUF6481 family protein [Rhizobium gallicum]WFU89425.1 DUF6481 family protein [Rhizobium sp. CC1099]
MRHPGDDNFANRRKAANEAKQHLLDKLKAAPKADDPEMVARRAERRATAEARELRRAERVKSKQEEAERNLAAAAALADAANAEARAKAEERETQERERIARVISDEADRKAERDRRYAARKARRV